MIEVFGILNITRDSFSDGGHYLDSGAAIAHAKALVEAGAHHVDVGAQSTHPDSEQVGAEEEIRRLAPVLPALTGAGISVSVDTYQPEVQRYAIEQGVGFINDVNGFPDLSVYRDLARSECKLIVMHSIQREGGADRRDSNPETIVQEIISFFEQRVAQLVSAGISRTRIILDPGMGFFLGKNADSSIVVLGAIPDLKDALNLPIMVSVSRKSFLGSITGRPVQDRGAATLAAELFAARRGIDYLRTHDVAAFVDGWRVSMSLNKTLD